jgi:hypothetical protein
MYFQIVITYFPEHYLQSSPFKANGGGPVLASSEQNINQVLSVHSGHRPLPRKVNKLQIITLLAKISNGRLFKFYHQTSNI